MIIEQQNQIVLLLTLSFSLLLLSKWGARVTATISYLLWFLLILALKIKRPQRHISLPLIIGSEKFVNEKSFCFKERSFIFSF
jgi:hypothetical protein